MPSDDLILGDLFESKGSGSGLILGDLLSEPKKKKAKAIDGGSFALRQMARKIAEEHGVNPDLFDSLVTQESRFNPNARNPKSGASGLGQLMPGTARDLGVRDVFDPEENLRGAAKYLKQQLNAFGGDTRKALAAYNAGPGNVRKYGGIPPFKETQNYVPSILNRMASKQGATNGLFTKDATYRKQAQPAQTTSWDQFLKSLDETGYLPDKPITGKGVLTLEAQRRLRMKDTAPARIFDDPLVDEKPLAPYEAPLKVDPKEQKSADRWATNLSGSDEEGELWDFMTSYGTTGREGRETIAKRKARLEKADTIFGVASAAALSTVSAVSAGQLAARVLAPLQYGVVGNTVGSVAGMMTAGMTANAAFMEAGRAINPEIPRQMEEYQRKYPLEAVAIELVAQTLVGNPIKSVAALGAAMKGDPRAIQSIAMSAGLSFGIDASTQLVMNPNVDPVQFWQRVALNTLVGGVLLNEPTKFGKRLGMKDYDHSPLLELLEGYDPAVRDAVWDRVHAMTKAQGINTEEAVAGKLAQYEIDKNAKGEVDALRGLQEGFDSYDQADQILNRSLLENERRMAMEYDEGASRQSLAYENAKNRYLADKADLEEVRKAQKAQAKKELENEEKAEQGQETAEALRARGIEPPAGMGVKKIIRGSFLDLSGNRSLINLNPEANVSTIVHETGHYLRTRLPLKWFERLTDAMGEGAFEGDGVTLTTEAEELFARNWENFVYRGRTSPELRPIFDVLAAGLHRAYATRADAPIHGKLSQKWNEVFSAVADPNSALAQAAKRGRAIIDQDPELRDEPESARLMDDDGQPKDTSPIYEVDDPKTMEWLSTQKGITPEREQFLREKLRELSTVDDKRLHAYEDSADYDSTFYREAFRQIMGEDAEGSERYNPFKDETDWYPNDSDRDAFEQVLELNRPKSPEEIQAIRDDLESLEGITAGRKAPTEETEGGPDVRLQRVRKGADGRWMRWGNPLRMVSIDALPPALRRMLVDRISAEGTDRDVMTAGELQRYNETGKGSPLKMAEYLNKYTNHEGDVHGKLMVPEADVIRIRNEMRAAVAADEARARAVTEFQGNERFAWMVKQTIDERRDGAVRGFGMKNSITAEIRERLGMPPHETHHEDAGYTQRIYEEALVRYAEEDGAKMVSALVERINKNPGTFFVPPEDIALLDVHLEKLMADRDNAGRALAKLEDEPDSKIYQEAEAKWWATRTQIEEATAAMRNSGNVAARSLAVRRWLGHGFSQIDPADADALIGEIMARRGRKLKEAEKQEVRVASEAYRRGQERLAEVRKDLEEQRIANRILRGELETNRSYDRANKPLQPQNLDKEENRLLFELRQDQDKSLRQEDDFMDWAGESVLDRSAGEQDARVPKGKNPLKFTLPDGSPAHLASDLRHAGRSAKTREYMTKVLDAMRAVNAITLAAPKKGVGGEFLPEPVLHHVTDIRQMLEHFARNLVMLHNLAPEEVRKYGRLWYDGGNRIARTWAKRFDITVRQAAAMLAVHSPQTDWFKNVSRVERILDFMAEVAPTNPKWTPEMLQTLSGWQKSRTKAQEEAARLEDPDDDGGIVNAQDVEEMKGLSWEEMTLKQRARFIRAWDETYNSRRYRSIIPDGRFGDFAMVPSGKAEAKMSWASFSHIEKSLKIYYAKGEGMDAIIDVEIGKQHKVRNFFNNINTPNSDNPFFTSDTHNAAASHGLPLGGSDTVVKRMLGGAPSSAPAGISGTYPIYHEAGKIAAKALGLQAREIQSISWETIRAIFTNKSKPVKIKAYKIWEEYHNGRLTHDQAWDNLLDLAKGITDPQWTRYLETASGRRSSYRDGEIFLAKDFAPLELAPGHPLENDPVIFPDRNLPFLQEDADIPARVDQHVKDFDQHTLVEKILAFPRLTGGWKGAWANDTEIMPVSGYTHGKAISMAIEQAYGRKIDPYEAQVVAYRMGWVRVADDMLEIPTTATSESILRAIYSNGGELGYFDVVDGNGKFLGGGRGDRALSRVLREHDGPLWQEDEHPLDGVTLGEEPAPRDPRMPIQHSGFYSEAEKLLRGKGVPQRMKGTDLLKFLAGRGIKAEEIEWLGIKDFDVEEVVKVQDVIQRIQERIVDVAPLDDESTQFEYAKRFRPGGKDYRIGLYLLPNQNYQAGFVGKHFTQEGVVANAIMTRHNDGMSMHVSEMQSDLHQAAQGSAEEPGRGYGDPTEITESRRALKNEFSRLQDLADSYTKWDYYLRRARNVAQLKEPLVYAKNGDIPYALKLIKEMQSRTTGWTRIPVTIPMGNLPRATGNTRFIFAEGSDPEGTVRVIPGGHGVEATMHIPLDQIEIDWAAIDSDIPLLDSIEGEDDLNALVGKSLIDVPLAELEALVKKVDAKYDETRRLEGEVDEKLKNTPGEPPVPDAPWKKTWHELAIKKVILQAAASHIPIVTFDGGRTNALRSGAKKPETMQRWYGSTIPKYLAKLAQQIGAVVFSFKDLSPVIKAIVENQDVEAIMGLAATDEQASALRKFIREIQSKQRQVGMDNARFDEQDVKAILGMALEDAAPEIWNKMKWLAQSPDDVDGMRQNIELIRDTDEPVGQADRDKYEVYQRTGMLLDEVGIYLPESAVERITNEGLPLFQEDDPGISSGGSKYRADLVYRAAKVGAAKGARNVEEVVSYIRTLFKMPDTVTDSEIRGLIIAGQPPKAPSAEKAKVSIQRIVAEAKLLDDIEAALRGEYVKPAKKAPGAPSPLTELRRRLQKILEETDQDINGATTYDEVKAIERKRKVLDKLLVKVATYEGKLPSTEGKPTITAEHHDLNNAIASARRTLRLRDTIKVLEDQIARNDFEKEEKPAARPKSPEEIEAEEAVKRLRQKIQEMIEGKIDRGLGDKLAKAGQANVLLSVSGRLLDFIANGWKMGSHATVMSTFEEVASATGMVRHDLARRRSLLSVRKWRRITGGGDFAKRVAAHYFDTDRKMGGESWGSKAASATDAPFKEVYRASALDDMAHFLTKRMGKSYNGAVRESLQREIFDQLMGRTQGGPLDGTQVQRALDVANDYALRHTYNHGNVAADLVSAGRQKIHNGLRMASTPSKRAAYSSLLYAFETTFRFTKTITNLALENVDNTPLGLAQGVARMAGGDRIQSDGPDMPKNSIGAEEQQLIGLLVARGLTGTAMMVMGMLMAEQKKYNPGIIKRGRAGYTVNIPDFMMELGGLSRPFFIGVGLAEANRLVEDGYISEEDMGKVYLSMVAEYATSTPMLSGPKMWLRGLEDPKGFERIGTRILTSHIPGLPLFRGAAEFGEDMEDMKSWATREAFGTNDEDPSEMRGTYRKTENTADALALGATYPSDWKIPGKRRNELAYGEKELLK